MDILVTGGTVFASRFTAEYFVKRGHRVYVLNRNTRPQSEGVILIEADRHALGDTLKKYSFDAVLDIASYNETDVRELYEALGEVKQYIFISSSAVYPETLPQPFNENQKCGANIHWGDYGTNKIAAEKYITKKHPQAYIIRPPYLYGQMNNVYREAFVFECAEKNLPFYIPKDGSMPLQFFHIEDMCRFMEILLEEKPEQHIFNVGNEETVSIIEWVTLCYSVLGKTPELRYVGGEINQRSYFPFLDYKYVLDVSEMNKLMMDTKPLAEGLKESYEWYKDNRELVRKKPLLEFIEENLG